ncbi:MAG TPA: carboxylesterase family protein [Acidimicrobiales bacterium]|nr:carboxylesterase family protein [Acidimicrobiales bacterium]
MTVVATTAGDLRGVCEEGGCVAFLGVPFAEPPVGRRRFRPPVPVARWSGVRAAERYGPAAAQLAKRGIFDPLDPIDEDCLYLNVWTPAPDDGARPVLVWIHGGGLRGGSGAEAVFRGSHLAARGDCVMVTINYRLGALGGFVLLEELGDPRLAESANVGLLDQLMALRWVQDNVAAFGGDPRRVTVAGQSSGGQSVGVFLGLPEAAGLFAGAIAQSPAPTRLLDREVARQLGERYAAHLSGRGVDRGDIATAPAADLVAAVASLKKETDWGPIGHPLHPIVDGRVIARQPLDVLASGGGNPVPLLAGSNRDELVLRIGATGAGEPEPAPTEAELAEAWRTPFPGSTDGRSHAAQLAAAYNPRATAGLDPPGPPPTPFLQGERMTRISAIRLLEAAVGHGPPAFSYLFTWDPPSHCGAAHCLELPLVFDTAGESKIGRLYGEGGDEVAAMTDLIQSAWVAFVRTGDPATESLPAWPRYEPDRRATMLLDRSPRVLDDPWRDQRKAWEGVV